MVIQMVQNGAGAAACWKSILKNVRKIPADSDGHAGSCHRKHEDFDISHFCSVLGPLRPQESVSRATQLFHAHHPEQRICGAILALLLADRACPGQPKFSRPF